MGLKLLIVPILLYAVIAGAFFLAQTWLLFPAGSVPPAGPLPASADRLELLTPSGHRLYGAHVRPVVAREERFVVLGFGGNGWNADAAAIYLHDLYPEADIVTFHYRGYPPSEGRPSAAALMADAPLVHDFIRSRFGTRRIVAVGFSIGGGVAASLASRRSIDGVILVTPFDSLAAVAAGHYPWLPVRLLMRHRMEPAAELRLVRTPVAIVAGSRDGLIPNARTSALRRAVGNLVFHRTIADAGHNDIYQNPAFGPAMREALEKILSHETNIGPPV